MIEVIVGKVTGKNGQNMAAVAESVFHGHGNQTFRQHGNKEDGRNKLNQSKDK